MVKQIQIFLRIFPFKYGKKNKFLSSSVIYFWESHNNVFKENSLWISPKMFQNNRKAFFSSMWLILWSKKFLLIFIPYYWFDLKQLFQIFLLIWAFQTWSEKQISEYFRTHFWDSHFMSKKKSSLWISPKIFEKTERHSLAVCSSLWEETQFWLIFTPFKLFEKKQLFNQIQIFYRICIFKHGMKN